MPGVCQNTTGIRDGRAGKVIYISCYNIIGVDSFRTFGLQAIFQVIKSFIIERVNKLALLNTGNFNKITKPQQYLFSFIRGKLLAEYVKNIGNTMATLHIHRTFSESNTEIPYSQCPNTAPGELNGLR
jgi:hypothetical protein